ncbi:Branched-chain amino acid ABC transporter, amino acid-binding protein [Nitrincola lacisaponensis]|uniref:Branched-chain amino acid ABC transporter, amino acid-binding protein n=1 Tax=Nitrincola lacisaponensis TaxID=267850 RepID=A0A063Y1G0_9GAMM|nr:ABC transporter substrate-binding protein [Nitrincola lacisaponensis]KDE38960.1 Branched-chain amino acid ABC transporter, amino acid-binding protein [Nitrincola lacisaponensis]
MIKKTLLCSAIVAATAMTSLAHAEVKLGFLGGFTGPIESLAPPIYQGAQLAISQINEQGGILGGQTLTISSADTTCTDASAAINAADRMINTENVVAIVGALCSGATIAAANNVAVPAGVVMVSPASTSPAIAEINDNDLVFRTTPSDSYQGEVLARLLLSKGIKEVVVTYVNNDYGQGLANAFSATYEAEGGFIAANAAHEDGKADYRSELGSLASSGVDNLLVLAYADTSGQTILRQAYESGNFTQYIGADGMVGDALVNAVGADVLEGMIATRPGKPDIPGTEAYAEAARAIGMDPNAVFASQAYDAAFLLALAIEKNGSAERAGLNEALRAVALPPGEVILPGEWEKAVQLLAEGKEINYEGAAGTQDFDERGNVPGVIEEMVVRDGSFQTVGLIE